MKLQKSTWAGIALILGTITVVATGFAGGENAPEWYGTIASIVKFVAPLFSGVLIAGDAGKPSI
jgi:hypothetical protein